MNLTPTSFIVLGLIERAGAATPYELKTMLAAGIGNFWSVPRSQLYAEPGRLVGGGYLTESRQLGGRHRRIFRLTDRGRDALREWREAATDELPELRDLSLLKLFFGGPPAQQAPRQQAAHEAKLAEYERIRDSLDPAQRDAGPALTLQAAVAHERIGVRYWREIAQSSAPGEERDARR
jgi:DNA-binding PadR family transcriptional regulator